MTQDTLLNGHNGENEHPKSPLPVEFIALEDGDSWVHSVTTNGIAVVTSGTALADTEDRSGWAVRSGELVFIPIGSRFILRATAPFEMIVFRYEVNVRFCDFFEFELAEGESLQDDECKVGIKKGLNYFLEGLKLYRKDGILNGAFMEHKSIELLYLIRRYYTREEQLVFFHKVFHHDYRFSEFVFDNWQKVRSIKELAGISIYSESSFRKKFMEIFHLSPYKWLNQKKSVRILHELSAGHLTLKEITEKYQFGSVQQFNTYCKKNFGATPGQIRKRTQLP